MTDPITDNKIEYLKYPIVLENFDWIFYIKNNVGLNKFVTQIDCFRHWKEHGCYEGRKIRNLKNDDVMCIKLKPNQQFTHKIHHAIQNQEPKATSKPTINSKVISKPIPTITKVVVNHPPKMIRKPTQIEMKPKIEIVYVGSKIKLNKPIAVLVHVFDPQYISFFVKNVNFLHTKYTNDSIHVFINIVEENNPRFSDGIELRKYVNEQCAQIDDGIKVEIVYSENRGGDIGGFLILCQKLRTESYNHIIFVHSKTKLKWKYELCSVIFNYPLHLLTDSVGTVGSNKWTRTINYKTDIHRKCDIQNFLPHFDTLFKFYDINTESIDSWKFIAGTMFILNIKVVNYILSHNINSVYMSLNKLESVDENWIRIIKAMKLDNKGCGNDLQYRVKFGHPLHADYMIEHAYERIIGLISSTLKLKMLSQ